MHPTTPHENFVPAAVRSADWSHKLVLYELSKRGLTFSDLARANPPLRPDTLSKVQKTPMERAQAIIAAALDLPPQTIWPSRYDADGNPVRPVEWLYGRPAKRKRKPRR